MDSYTTSNGSSPNHAHNRRVILFYHMWGPAWIKIHWNGIWLRARSHMAFTLHLSIRDHTTWFGRCVGMAFGHFSFGLSQFHHGHGSWLVCGSQVALNSLNNLLNLLEEWEEDFAQMTMSQVSASRWPSVGAQWLDCMLAGIWIPSGQAIEGAVIGLWSIRFSLSDDLAMEDPPASPQKSHAVKICRARVPVYTVRFWGGFGHNR